MWGLHRNVPEICQRLLLKQELQRLLLKQELQRQKLVRQTLPNGAPQRASHLSVGRKRNGYRVIRNGVAYVPKESHCLQSACGLPKG